MKGTLTICLTLLFLITAEAQRIRRSEKLDSLKLLKSEGRDSTWLIRHEKLNESAETVIIITFQENILCMSNGYFDPNRLILRENFNWCIQNDSNRIQIFNHLIKYQEQFKANLRLVDVRESHSNRTILFESQNERYEYRSIDLDDIFISRLLKIAMYDFIEGKVYVDADKVVELPIEKEVEKVKEVETVAEKEPEVVQEKEAEKVTVEPAQKKKKSKKGG